MAFNRGGNRGRSQRSETNVRLTGLFKSKKKRGLSVGSVSELDDLINLIKAAKKQDKGLVVFLWRNEPDESSDKVQPDFTLYMDLNQQEDDRGRGGRRIQADPDDEQPQPKRKPKPRPEPEDDPEPEPDDDEVPF